MVDINIVFCRTMLKSMHAEVRKHFPRIKVRDAAVLHSGFRGQWLFEFMHQGERYAEYVSGDNAYEARCEGWQKFLRDKGIKEWQA